MLWLAGPVVATTLAALWAWLRSRPPAPPTTREAMQAHRDYLDALARTARERDRPGG